MIGTPGQRSLASSTHYFQGSATFYRVLGYDSTPCVSHYLANLACLPRNRSVTHELSSMPAVVDARSLLDRLYPIGLVGLIFHRRGSP